MKPQVLLINPWIYDFAAYDMWASPLGLLYLGAMLRHAGTEVRLVDCLDRNQPGAQAPPNQPSRLPGTGRWRREIVSTPAPLSGVPRHFARYGCPEEVFRREVARGPRPDLILVTSSMTYWYPGVVKVIGLLRDLCPQSPIILGGTYATLCPDHARRHSGADLVLTGPGEQALPPILTEILGPAFSQSELPEWTSVWPALDLYPDHEFAPLLTSRGCPGRCPYCSSRIMFPGVERRDPEDVAAEIEDRYRRWGIHHFTFFDDALLVHGHGHLRPILEKVCRRELALFFHAPNGLHVNLISQDLARLMFRAGFRTIRLGLETLDPTRQKTLGGKVLPGDFEIAWGHLLAAGFDPANLGVYLLYGLPGQELAEVQATVAAVKALGARPYLAEYSPLPSTAMWEQARAASPFDLAGEPLCHNNSFFPCRGPDFSWEKIGAIKRVALTGMI